MPVDQTDRLIHCSKAATLASCASEKICKILEPVAPLAMVIWDVEKPDQSLWRLRACISDNWSHTHIRLEQAEAANVAELDAVLSRKLKDFLAAKRRVAFRILPGTYPGDSLTNLRLTLNKIPGMGTKGLKMLTDVEFIPCTAVVAGTCFKIIDFVLEVDASVQDEVAAALERQGFEVQNIKQVLS